MNQVNYAVLFNTVVVLNKILESVFGQGTKNFLNDLIPVLQIVGALICVVFFIVAGIKKSNEEDGPSRKKYTIWQIGLAIGCVIIIGAKEILNLGLSYFGMSLE